MRGPQIAWLAGGRRLHCNHGPIDLIIEAFGAPGERQRAYRQAAARFATILEELVAELALLRQPSGPSPRPFLSAAARRMEAATCRHAGRFITPMAAVAGAVADEVLTAMTAGTALDKAYVNNGGDVAVHLAAGQTLSAAIAGTGHGFADRLLIAAADPVRGIATSGWRGRSFSLGIADAVTVLAATAAAADAAATVVGNAVDLPGHPAIERVPARALAPDSDLGDRPVTYRVGELTRAEIDKALDNGTAEAQRLRQRGAITGAALFLAGDSRMVGPLRTVAAVPDIASERIAIHA